MGSSHENLMSHVHSQHPGDKDLFKDCNDLSQEQPDSYLLGETSQSYVGWVDMIVDELFPLSLVERPTARRHAENDSTCVNTLLRPMEKRTVHIKF